MNSTIGMMLVIFGYLAVGVISMAIFRRANLFGINDEAFLCLLESMTRKKLRRAIEDLSLIVFWPVFVISAIVTYIIIITRF